MAFVDYCLRKFHIPIAIIPDKLKNMSVVMKDIGEQFKRLWEEGMWVTPGKVDPLGRVSPGQPFKHTPYLSSIYADSVARQDFAHISGSASATLVCQWCALPGTSLYKINIRGKKTFAGV